jgi:hypothetical protein
VCLCADAAFARISAAYDHFLWALLPKVHHVSETYVFNSALMSLVTQDYETLCC